MANASARSASATPFFRQPAHPCRIPLFSPRSCSNSRRRLLPCHIRPFSILATTVPRFVRRSAVACSHDACVHLLPRNSTSPCCCAERPNKRASYGYNLESRLYRPPDNLKSGVQEGSLQKWNHRLCTRSLLWSRMMSPSRVWVAERYASC